MSTTAVPARTAAAPVPRGTGLVLAALTALLWWPLRGFRPDDTYIHLQYAKHLRDGHGLVFNLGERVYGSTSPLWSALLAGLGALGIDLPAAATGLSLVAALGAAALGARVFGRFVGAGSPALPAARVAAVLAAVAWATDAWFVRWAGSGMETSLAVLLVLAGFERYTATDPWGARPAPAAWAWAAAALVRPEAALLGVLLVAHAALDPRGARARRASLFAAAGPWLALGVPWGAATWAYYGTPLPVTMAAKASEYAGLSGSLRIARLMALEFAASRPIESLSVVVAGVGALAGAARRGGPTRAVVRAHLLPLGWLVGLPGFFLASGIPGVTRYLVPITPLLVAYGWRALARGLPDARRLAVAAAAGLAVTAWTFFGHVVPQARAFEAGLARTLVAQGRWFAAHTPSDARVAVRDIGAFAYYSDRAVLDLGGLVTPGMAPLLRRHGYDDLVVGLRFADRERPDYLVDVATEPRRMEAASPYAACLSFLGEGRLDDRALTRRGPAWVTAYRIDWACVDALPPRSPAP